MDACTDDLKFDAESGSAEILCEPAAFQQVQEALAAKGLEFLEANVAQIPSAPVAVDPDLAAQVAKLLDALDEHDDVQNVYSNAEMPEAAA
jgi:transcriptional/translational regulatory protein YebC/TACO1